MHRQCGGKARRPGRGDGCLHRVVAGLEHLPVRSCGPGDLDGRAPFVCHRALVRRLNERSGCRPCPKRITGAVFEEEVVLLACRERQCERRRVHLKPKRCWDRAGAIRRTGRHTKFHAWRRFDCDISDSSRDEVEDPRAGDGGLSSAQHTEMLGILFLHGPDIGTSDYAITDLQDI